MSKPNFFLVGAPRCGTTSVYVYLKQHPEIYLAIQKEPHYFGSDLTPLPGGIREEGLYLSLFAGAGERPRVGEGSVYYLSSRKAAAEIADYAPDARILMVLRDPIQMAYSLYGLYRRTGNEDLPTFEAALGAEPDRRERRRLAPGTYFPEGLLYTAISTFSDQVERYFQVFGRDRVHCILFDDMLRDPAAMYRRALEFLGVDADFAAEFEPHKAQARVRMQAVRQLRDTLPEVRQRIQFGQIKVHEAPVKLPPLEGATRARLREIFQPDVERLAGLLDRDLSAWLQPPTEVGEARATVTLDSKTESNTASSAEPSVAPKPAESAAVGLREILEGVRLIKKIPADLRARHEGVETLERKFGRWQRLRIPHLPLEQRPPNPEWAGWFAAEGARVRGALGSEALLVEHFGSTSVPGLPSKNIIDMAVGVEMGSERGRQVEALAAIGYGDYGNSPVDPETIWLWRVEDDRAFVLHLGERERPWIDEQMDLRDYFRCHPDERDRYAELKRKLALESGQSFLQFTVGKMALSLELVDRARDWRRSQAGEIVERTTISR